MSELITAVVENGMLRPERPLKLAEGVRVDLTLTPHVEPVPRQSTNTLEFMSRIAALPDGGPADDPNVSRDHDHYLYEAPRRS